MELTRDSCVFCNETKTVLSQSGSAKYFRLLDVGDFFRNGSQEEFDKFFQSKHLCVGCAFKVEKIKEFIEKTTSKYDEYTFKKSRQQKCNWCFESKKDLFSFYKHADELKCVTEEFAGVIIGKDLNFDDWKICLVCNFCVISWGMIRKRIEIAETRLETPKLKIHNQKNKTTKTTKRKREESSIERQLKHLKSIKNANKRLNISNKCSKDQRMMLEIPYVYLSVENLEETARKLQNDESSESEIEYVEPSTSSGPTRPPVRRKRHENAHKSTTPKKRVSFSEQVLEIKDDYSNEIENRRTPARINKRTSESMIDISDDDDETTVKKHKNEPNNDKKYSCSICDEDFPTKCDQKLHEIEHNINFSPVVLLDTTDVERNHRKDDSDEETSRNDTNLINGVNGNDENKQSCDLNSEIDEHTKKTIVNGNDSANETNNEKENEEESDVSVNNDEENDEKNEEVDNRKRNRNERTKIEDKQSEETVKDEDTVVEAVDSRQPTKIIELEKKNEEKNDTVPEESSGSAKDTNNDEESDGNDEKTRGNDNDNDKIDGNSKENDVLSCTLEETVGNVEKKLNECSKIDKPPKNTTNTVKKGGTVVSSSKKISNNEGNLSSNETSESDSIKSACGSSEASVLQNLADLEGDDENIEINQDLDDRIEKEEIGEQVEESIVKNDSVLEGNLVSLNGNMEKTIINDNSLTVDNVGDGSEKDASQKNSGNGRANDDCFREVEHLLDILGA